MSNNPFLRQRLITELDTIFDGVTNASYYRTRNHRFERAVANAVSDYTDQRIDRYDREVISIERRRITSLENRVTDLERRVTILEQRFGQLSAQLLLRR
jgi:hypothetical protein